MPSSAFCMSFACLYRVFLPVLLPNAGMLRSISLLHDMFRTLEASDTKWLNDHDPYRRRKQQRGQTLDKIIP